MSLPHLHLNVLTGCVFPLNGTPASRTGRTPTARRPARLSSAGAR
ncbi:hypothetical protein ABII15_17785 [Streptomyces sp. HUAS MG91]|uniref:Transposase n=1 Tax=Streptomyces tabacisoli TaxID=3156398 RepID=A0AAU8ITJ3_9ACTN